MLPSYRFPEFSEFSRLLVPLTAAEDALARLDERLHGSPLADGVNARLAFAEACASRLGEGQLVHLEDLVLFDAGAFDGPVSPELSSALDTLGTWRRVAVGHAASLLSGDRPGQPELPKANAPGPENWLHDRQWDEPTRLAAWRDIARQSEDLPPVLAAAIAWDAWLVLQPEQRAAWRAPLLASLSLRARNKTRSLLLPIDLGRRFAEYRRHPVHGFEQRIAGFLGWVMAATVRAGKELDSLILAEGLLRRSLVRRRRNSRLPDFAHLLLSRPLVSVPMVARSLRISQQAVQRMLPELTPPARELSGRRRYRVWAIL